MHMDVLDSWPVVEVEDRPPMIVNRIVERETMAPVDVQTHRESSFRRSMQSQNF
jgi:hypothetical protein